jgi:uncharacterized protein
MQTRDIGAMTASEPATDQSEIFAFLSDPNTFKSTRAVRRIDTHGASVFLAGDDVYKVKRAVRFPFMDFSTLEKRRLACEAEIAVNKPNAPDIYINVVPVVRATGGLALAGPGEPVEWAVHMRRFDEEATLDRIADRHLLTPELIAPLAQTILQSHERAQPRDGAAATASLARYIEENDSAFASEPEFFDVSQARRLTQASRDALAKIKTLLIARGDAGYVRRCHGDLHLRNIALIDKKPILFDAVEFDDKIATGDVLYDLAFLLMDLEERQLRAEANLALNRYLWASDEAHLTGLSALPLFLSLRAAIRAKVSAAALSRLQDTDRLRTEREAGRYFRFAQDFLRPHTPMLVAVGGLSGVGKSAVSGRIAPSFGRSPGALWLRSDIERKRMFGAAETEHLPQTAYTEAAARKVYASLRHKAALALNAGQAVVLDAMHAKPQERDLAEGLASEIGVNFVGLWLEAPSQSRIERVTGRSNDASDADAAIARSQTATDPDDGAWRRVDTAGDVDSVTRRALEIVQKQHVKTGS